MDYYIGLMSGTSLDGVDASLIQTDGKNYFLSVADVHIFYPINFRNEIKDVIAGHTTHHRVESILTDFHAEAVHELLKKSAKKADNVKALGFHGQTIFHCPSNKITWQIGNPHQLAQKTGIDVVHDFRRRDVALGGQGAPLVPIFHKCLMQNEVHPVVVANIGGVANITYIDKDLLIAFDTGPGNSLIDDSVNKYYNLPFDDKGLIASEGIVDYKFADQILSGRYFQKPPPKSLDRNEFSNLISKMFDHNPQNIIATLTYLTAKSIVEATSLLPCNPKTIYLCGGGSKNLTLINQMEHCSTQSGKFIEFINITKKKGMDPDFIESQAFAYLAARFLLNLPSAFPSTTGASAANVCGNMAGK